VIEKNKFYLIGGNKKMSSILTIEEAAEYLKFGSDELLLELENNRLPGTKIAGKWRLKKEVLDRMFEGQTEINESSKSVIEPDKQSAITLTVENNTISSEQTLNEITISPDKSKKEEGIPASEKIEVEKNSEVGNSPVKSIYSPGLDTVYSTCVRGRIFAYNHKQKFGHARLADGRFVQIQSQYFIDKNYAPQIGDIVEFNIKLTSKGLQSSGIIFISHNGNIVGESDAQYKSIIAEALPKQAIETINRPLSFKPTVKAYQKPEKHFPFSKNYLPSEGTPESQEFYQKAALAVTEKRTNDARRLFRQAIEAGAGIQVYEIFFKMLVNVNAHDEARNLIRQAIQKIPNHPNFYIMFGQMERRKKNYSQAEQIFREGLKRLPYNFGLQLGLAQTLVEIGTSESIDNAGKIFKELERNGKLNRNDTIYHRYLAFHRDPRANKVYEFFHECEMKPGITGFSNIPKNVTDIVVEFNNPEFRESFGISGHVLIRCFRYNPKQTDLIQLQEYLRSFGSKEILGLQDSRRVIINKSLAFIAVANSSLVTDHVMSILSEHGEAIIPLDDTQLKHLDSQVQILRDVLAQYLGMRDLYSRTLPVSGRRFFGREKLLIHLTDEIHSGQFLGIYGLRKMGKTSLLYQLRDEKLRDEAVAYVDLQSSNSLSVGNCNPLYWELERDLYLRLHEREKEVANLLRLGKIGRFSDLPIKESQQSGLIFSEDMRSILDALAVGKISSVKRLVIVLDELERILPVGGQSGIEGYIEFFGLLRGLAQTERYRGLLSSIVVAANASISERGYWEGKENPVFALYKSVFMPPFTIEESNEMIVTLGKNMSVYWEEDTLKTIFAETGGHPFLTRILCSRIVKQYPARPLTVKGEMVNEQLIPFIRSDSDKLEQITELLHTHFPNEEIYLNQIALDEMPGSIPDETLRHLLGYNLIKSDGRAYQITINLLRRWLRRRAGEKD